MCVDHEHHTSYSTETYNNLCFRHATLEAINGNHVETETVTYEGQTDCEVCDIEREQAKEKEV